MLMQNMGFLMTSNCVKKYYYSLLTIIQFVKIYGVENQHLYFNGEFILKRSRQTINQFTAYRKSNQGVAIGFPNVNLGILE